ncbi:MAG TPA: hypothetical protein VHN14_20460 [Kofleriaceae bacterium]|nr:hypothetical protein [Kofleriaceae bacterium]
MTDRDRPHPDAEVVERLERDLPARSQGEEETRAVYQRLIGKIGDLDLVEPAPGWEDRAVERWRREAKPRRTAKPPRRVPWRPIAAVVAVSTVAALVLLIPRCGDRELPALQVAVDRTGPPNRQAAPAIGDMLRAHMRVDGPHGELRVYRDRVLIARCPGDARCRRDGANLSIALVMDVAGQYETIRLSSGEPLPPPQARGLDVDVLTANERGAHVVREPPITVR